MAVQVLIFNKSNTLLAEVEPNLEFVNWRLNNTGKAVFSMSYSDVKCTPTNLAFGNRVLIRFNNGLPDWGGVIDTPRQRTWHNVTVNAYTAEKLIDWRVTAKSRYFRSQEPGYIFSTLLLEESAIMPVGVSVGSVYMGGDARTLEYHYHDLLARYGDLATLTGMDFAVVPSYVNGVLTFNANWYQARGSDRSSRVHLIEGHNCTEVVLDEQGTIANAIRLAGAGDGWGSSRITSEAEDTESQSAYGYREYAEVQTGVSEQATLDANAAQLLASMRAPAMRYTVGKALNRAPAMYSAYDVGDTVGLKALLRSGAWQPVDTTVRIIAREWQPDGACRLEVV